MGGAASDGLRFAGKLLALIDGMNRSASYKYATLLALIDEATAELGRLGREPTVLRGRLVGRRVVESYWPQTRPFGPRALTQSPQNDIPAKLAAWRVAHRLPAHEPLAGAAAADPVGWARLEAELVGVVIGMPLAKLQRFGSGRAVTEDRFIYDFGWPDEVSWGVTARADFDDTMPLRPGVGEWLVELGPLVRPVVQARWATWVAGLNTDLVDTAQLDGFLFGAVRHDLTPLRRPLLRAQRHRCFYCPRPLDASVAEVDHFLPWSRQPDNTIDNLVVAHRRCNGDKSASLASSTHLRAWLRRSAAGSAGDRALADASAQAQWPRRPERTLASVRGAYLSLYDDQPLWEGVGAYERADPVAIRRIIERREPPQPEPLSLSL
ncbi:MAG TPA: HNH endonuclease signature motif containing protein [Acidimicrobiales bacterium]|nr:HNH endonuclease signature motif containing protein [Acidimicrobiales bacterium]